MRRKAEKEVGAEPPADDDNAARRHLGDRSRPKRSTKHDLEGSSQIAAQIFRGVRSAHGGEVGGQPSRPHTEIAS
ncbi:hypothetical protein Misp02_63140 [Microtetraspora sp. NBRC 16547]|nr:hypothetical protein Misp02_63140 [Microtetraspora sp. NBRC 16547]